MQTRQVNLSSERLSAADLEPLQSLNPQLVLVFASLGAMRSGIAMDDLQAALPGAQWMGCSTAGEISGQGVADNSIVVTGIRFDSPDFRVASEPIRGMADSRGAGERLGLQLVAPGLRYVIVLGQGADINGSALVDGLQASVGATVVISGGLAGDAGNFSGSLVLGPDGIRSDAVVALGLYGDRIALAHGSFGGWQPFGPVRRVTRAEGNVLYALDGERALDIYKRYLGDYASQLPASGLLFPWSVLGADHSAVGLVRTILGVNEADGSLVLAGDVHTDGYLQLMRASVDALVDAAEAAADAANQALSADGHALVLLVSCIGRKLVMGARVDEEVEAVADVFGGKATLTGFYSNGEISPLINTTECKLHNQTMTITSITESA
jgi:hypothetical protein